MTTSSGATVQSVTARAVRVPMVEPHRTASGVITESPLVLVDVRTSDGVVGHGLAFTYTVSALKPLADLIANIAPLIVGDRLAPVEIASTLAAKFRLLGTEGLVGMGIAAIDMAVWDAFARAHRMSLAGVLGASPKPLRVYGAVGYDGVDGAAKTAEKWARQGVTGIKAKIGYPAVQEDLAVVRAMRAAAGPDMAIMVDYNQSLSPAEAIARVRVLDDEGLTWVEEPTLAHDFRGQAQIARAVRTPVQSGESWWGPIDLQHAIDAEATDVAMFDVMKIGGVTGWMRASAIADARGLRVSSHLWPEISAQLLCATPTAHWLEYADWWNPILASPLTIDHGFARIDDVEGGGVAWNEDAIARVLA
jgi:mandelate racemase